MQEKEELYWYWLCNLSGIGNKRIKRLLDVFKSPKAVFYAAPEALHGCTGLTQQNIETIMKNRNMEKVYKSFTQLQHKGILFIYKEGKQYPQNLLQLYDMPYGLYSKGQPLRADEPAVAMVGARGCSGYGRSVAYSFAKAFAQLGITVVSGMASGIDTAAHEGCIAGGGRTVAVLGNGVDICYPRENIRLYMQIQEKGTILSEYPPGTVPAAGRFPVRNRIISGISDAVIVVEARKRSGSLITADAALEQNRDVYVVPGNIGQPLSEGCNELIKQGAIVITKPEDIFQTKALKDKIFMNKTVGKGEEKEKIQKKFLATPKDMVYSCFDLYPKSLDELLAETGLEIADLNQMILEMQLEGLITEISKNCYVRNDLEI